MSSLYFQILYSALPSFLVPLSLSRLISTLSLFLLLLAIFFILLVSLEEVLHQLAVFYLAIPFPLFSFEFTTF